MTPWMLGLLIGCSLIVLLVSSVEINSNYDARKAQAFVDDCAAKKCVLTLHASGPASCTYDYREAR